MLLDLLFQIIEGLTTEKIDLKEQLDKANEDIKKMEVERQCELNYKYSFQQAFPNY